MDKSEVVDKAKRINRIRNSLKSEDDLYRRLPELDAIYDPDVREATVRTFMKACPDYFWERPTSSSGKYHSPDERGKHGNWLHTKRVFVQYSNLSESLLEMDMIGEYERSCGKSAALLHDMMKYGYPSQDRDHTTSQHDEIAAAVTQHVGECPDLIPELIAPHMGPWGEGPTPEERHQLVFHLADKAASGTDEDDLAVYYPHNDILKEWPDVISIEVEEDDYI